MIRQIPKQVDFLILGAGWTSTFLIPLLEREQVAHAATTTTGRDGTIAFKFDPDSSDEEPYARLPHAATVLITFPLTGHGQSKHLTSLYTKTHPSEHSSSSNPHFIQLGATSIWSAHGWSTRHSPYNQDNARAIAEDELLGLGGAVLDLAGLYGGTRNPRAFLTRVLKSRDDVRGKQALHMVHGADVARGLLGVHRAWGKAGGQRWLVTDLHCYDWWDLVADWCAAAQDEGNEVEQGERERERELMKWVWECMEEEDVRALPRGPEKLGRVLDAREFWGTIGLLPSVGRLR